MNEIADFIVEFSTKGLAEVKQGLSDIGEKIDKVGKSFSDSTSKSDNFLSSLGKIAGKLVGIGSAIALVGKGVSTALDVKDKTLDLQRLSAETGVAAQNIEALGISLRYGFGGDIANAGGFYRNLVEMRAKWQRGQVDKGQIEEMARAGFTIDPKAGLGEWMGSLADALSKADVGQRNLLAKAFGLDDSMMLFLSEGRQFVQTALEEHGAQAFMYKPENAKSAADLNNAIQDFKLEWQKIWVKIQPLLTKIITLVDEFLLPVLNTVVDLVMKLVKPLEEFVNWIIGKTKKVVEAVKEPAEEIAETVKDIIGGKSREDIEKAYEEKHGKTMDEIDEELMSKVRGKTFGDLIDGVTRLLMGEELYSKVEAAGMRESGGNTVVVPVSLDGKQVSVTQVNPDGSVMRNGTPIVMGVN